MTIHIDRIERGVSPPMIAAAPDLYEALELARHFVHGDSPEYVFKTIAAALAKARGGPEQSTGGWPASESDDPERTSRP